jgi:hypothetical protein
VFNNAIHMATARETDFTGAGRLRGRVTPSFPSVVALGGVHAGAEPVFNNAIYMATARRTDFTGAGRLRER